MSIFQGAKSNNQRHIWQLFSNTISARYIRFYPVSWNSHISMRAGVLNREEKVLNPPESARSYSSVWDNNRIGTGHARSKLDSVQAWSAGRNDGNQWMTIDLGSTQDVRGVVTQGRRTSRWSNQFVKTFKIGYSTDGRNFTMLNDTIVQKEVSPKKYRLKSGVRYIMITPPTPYIQISQIAVYAAGNPNVNIAKGKPVSVTSIYPRTRAENVVDGTLAPKSHPGGWHSLTGNANEYFLLDLQKAYPIDKVVYYNRGDCCQNRANGMFLRLQDENRNEVWTGTLSSAMVQVFRFESSVEDPYRFLPLEEKCQGYTSKLNVGEEFEKNYFKKAIAETCMPYYSKEFVKCKDETQKALGDIDLAIQKCAGKLHTCQAAFNITTQMVIISATYGEHNVQMNCPTAREQYLITNGDVKAAGVDPWGHYKTYGKKEGRKWPRCIIDVRQKIEELRAKGVKSVAVSNVTFGQDPVPGKKKQLRLVLKSSYDAEFEKIIQEGENLNLDFDNEAARKKLAEEEQARSRPLYTFSTLGKNQNGGQKGGYTPYNEELITGGGGTINLMSKLEDYLTQPAEMNTTDKNPNCKAWASKQPSECELNPRFMLANCAKSCASVSASPITPDLARANRERKYNIKHHADFTEFNKHYKPFSTCPTKDYVKKADVQHIYNKTLSLVEKLNALKNNFSVDIKTHPDYRLLLDKYALKNANGDYIDCVPCTQ